MKYGVWDRVAPSPGPRRTTLSLEGEGLGVRGNHLLPTPHIAHRAVPPVPNRRGRLPLAVG